MPIRNINQGQKVSGEKIMLAREMRRNMTPAERILWQELRGNKLAVHFRRQQVIAGFIVDFYCHSAGLVIEVDGGIHEQAEQGEYDAGREQIFNEMGLQVLRLRNEEIEKHLPAALDKIRQLVHGRA